jgi:hypothetical protein
VATITTGGSGNWSSGDGVGPWTGTTKPVNGDVVEIAAGHTVTLDEDTATLGAAGIKNVAGSNTSVLDISGTRTINGNVSHSGTATTGMVTYGTGDSLTINGQVTNSSTGSCCVGSGSGVLTISNVGGTAVSSTSIGKGVAHGSTGNLTVTGAVSATTNNGQGIGITAACTATIDGAVSSSNGITVLVSAGATVTVTGDCSATGTLAGTAVSCAGTGAAVSIVGNASSSNVAAALSVSNGTLTWIGARTLAAATDCRINLSGGTLALASAGGALTLTCSGEFLILKTGGTLTMTSGANNASIIRQIAAAQPCCLGQDISAYITGPTIPVAANVRYGISCGYAGALVTGDLQIPNSGTPTGTQDATSDACVASGKKYGSPERTGSAAAGYTYGDENPDKVLTTATGAGHYHAPEASEVQKGATVGETVGTLVGVVDSGGTQHNYGTCSSAQAWTADGIVHDSGTVSSSGTLTSAGAYNATGILSAAATYNATGILAAAGYAATGIYDGSSKYTSGVWNGTTRYATGILRDATTYSATGVWDGTNYGATGIIATGPTYYASGILDSGAAYNAEGILDGGIRYSSGIYDGSARTAKGVFDGTTAYSTGIFDGTTRIAKGILDAGGTERNTGVFDGTNYNATTGLTTSVVLTGSSWNDGDGSHNGAAFGDASAAKVLTTASAAGTYLAIAQSNARYTGSGYFGAGGAVDGTCYVPAAADVQDGVNVDATTGTFTSPAVGKVISDTSWGAGGTEFTGTYHACLVAEVLDTVSFGAGSGETGTYHAPEAAEVISTAVFGPASSIPGTYDVSNVAAGNIKDGVSIGGVTGTFTHTADYTLISGVAGASDVRKGVARYSGGDNGTLQGCVDSSGVNQGATGILASGTFYADGTLSGAGAYNATGVIYGSGSYATEASRNNATAGAAQILSGYSVTLLGSTTNGSATAEAHTANQVLHSAGGNWVDENLTNAKVLLTTEWGLTGVGTLVPELHVPNEVLKSAGGNYNDDNLSVGNVRPVAFGLSQTGTLANLVATDAAYLALEATRNSKTATAADILSGTSVTIAGATTDGTYHEATTGEVKNGTAFGPGSTLIGTYSPGGTYAEGQAAQLATDVSAVNAEKANILNTTTILTVTGTYDPGATVPIADVVSASWVVVGHSNYVGGSPGTYPTTETTQAAQLATDQAAVAAKLENIDGGVIILSQEGTGLNLATLTAALSAAGLTLPGGSYSQTVTVRTAGGVAIQGATVDILSGTTLIDTQTTNGSGVATPTCNAGLGLTLRVSYPGVYQSASSTINVAGAGSHSVTLTAISLPAPPVPGSGTVTGYGYCYQNGLVVAGARVYVKQVTPGGRKIYDGAVVTLTSSGTGEVSLTLFSDGSTYVLRSGVSNEWTAPFAPSEDTPGGGRYLLPGFVGASA